jgi:hypothetical protein
VLNFWNGCCCFGECINDTCHCGDCGPRCHTGDTERHKGDASGDRVWCPVWSTSTPSYRAGVIKRSGGCGARCDDGHRMTLGGGVRTGGGSWSNGRSSVGGVVFGNDDDRSNGIDRSDSAAEPLDDDKRCRTVRWSRWICGCSKRWRNPAMQP